MNFLNSVLVPVSVHRVIIRANTSGINLIATCILEVLKGYGYWCSYYFIKVFIP